MNGTKNRKINKHTQFYSFMRMKKNCREGKLKNSIFFLLLFNPSIRSLSSHTHFVCVSIIFAYEACNSSLTNELLLLHSFFAAADVVVFVVRSRFVLLC
jgi:hypothetical protein